MEENRNESGSNPSTQYIKSNNRVNTFSTDQQNRPRGTDDMNERYSQPNTGPQEQGDASKYANTSGNEEKENRT